MKNACSILVPAAILAAGGLGLMTTTAAAANLIPNASFELGLEPHGIVVSVPFAEHPVQPTVTLDASTAVDGRQSLKIDNTKTGGEAMLVTTAVRFPEIPCKNSMLSAYVKADRPTRVNLGVWRVQAVPKMSYSIDERTFDVGTEWTRIEMPRPRLAKDARGIAVRLNVVSDAVVWVDALQFEANARAASPFAPAAPIEATWVMRDRVFTRDGEAPARVTAELRVARTAKSASLPILFETPAGRFAMELKPGEVQSKVLTFDAPANGVFSLGGTFAAKDYADAVVPVSYAVVPKLAAAPKDGFRIGCNGALGIACARPYAPDNCRFRLGEKIWQAPLGREPDDLYRDLRRGGYSIVRMHDGGYSWEDIEREKGRFDWSTLDVMEAGLRKNGLEPMFVFGSHGVFSTKAHGEGPETNWFARVNSRMGRYKGKTKYGQGKRMFYHPKDEDWTDWITAAVTRYHKTVRLWEIVNEPNGTVESAPVYAHYAELAYKAVKAVDPDGIVIGICSTGDLGLNAAKFFKSAGEAGAFKWLDVASFHPYAQSQDVPGKNGEEALAALRQICDQYRPGVPLCETEVYYLNSFSPEQVAAWKLWRKNPKAPGAEKPLDDRQLKLFPTGNLIKRYAIDLGGGCTLATPMSSGQHEGLDLPHADEASPTRVATAFVPNDRFVASAVFASCLEGGVFLRKPALPATLNGYVYRGRKPGETALVWLRPEATETVPLKLPAGATARDLYGNPIAGDTVTVTHEPVYVFGGNLF